MNFILVLVNNFIKRKTKYKPNLDKNFLNGNVLEECSLNIFFFSKKFSMCNKSMIRIRLDTYRGTDNFHDFASLEDSFTIFRSASAT